MAYKIYLYDSEIDCIGSGCLSSQYVQWQLEAAAGQDVEVHISSVGGSAFDALAIYDMLKQYEGNVMTCIDALAASAASIVAMAGDVVSMSKYALLMIHKPAVISGGNADELQSDVEMLNIVQGRLVAIYMDKTKLDEETINSLVNATTWLSAEQALDLGFIDQIEDYAETDSKVTNSATVKKFVTSAPVVYQRVINKILSKENTPNPQNTIPMNIENKEFIEKTTSTLDKIMNFFKKVTNKSVTATGTLFHIGALAEGIEVFNDEDMEDKAKDGEMDVDDKIITVKDGKVLNIKAKSDPDKDGDDDSNPDTDPDEDDDEPYDRAIRATLVTNKVAKPVRLEVYNQVKIVKAAHTKLIADFNAQTILLNEAKAQLVLNNAELEKTRDEIKNEIKSDFTPEGSHRSTKGKKEGEPLFKLSPLAQTAVTNTMKNPANKAKL